VTSNDNDRPFMQRVYDSEISAVIEWFWDGGFFMKLGDPDEPDVQGNVRTWRGSKAGFASRSYGVILTASSARKSETLRRDRLRMPSALSGFGASTERR
jgi:hypothetical protein